LRSRRATHASPHPSGCPALALSRRHWRLCAPMSRHILPSYAVGFEGMDHMRARGVRARRSGDRVSSYTAPGTWRQWIEPWYLAYALLGAAVGGVVPIVVPLMVHRTGTLAATGLVMAAFNLGGLTAPLWGGLADRYRLHRVLLVGGFLLTTLGLVAFP